MPADGSALNALAALKPDAAKDDMIRTVDGAVDEVLALMDDASYEGFNDALRRVQFVLGLLEQCSSMPDPDFRAFARRRAQDIKAALDESVKARVDNGVGAAKPPPAKAQPADPRPPADPPAKAPQKAKAPEKAPEKAKDKPKEKPKDKAPVAEAAAAKTDFEFARFEAVTLKYVNQVYGRLLEPFLGSNPYGPDGVVQDGVPAFCLFEPQFSDLLGEALRELVIEGRGTLTRKVYRTLDADADDEALIATIRKTHHATVLQVITLGFEAWQRQENTHNRGGSSGDDVESPFIKAKQQKKTGMLGKLMGKKAKDDKPKAKRADVAKEPWHRVKRSFEKAEKEDRVFFGPEFSFGLLSYIARINRNQFEGEVQRIQQVADQRSNTSDVGPVQRILNEVSRSQDQTFYDLILLRLFYAHNTFDLNLLQVSCMAQKLSEGRLPLSVSELARRPLAHAKQVARSIEDHAGVQAFEVALRGYLDLFNILKQNRFGKEMEEARDHLKKRVSQASGPEGSLLKAVATMTQNIETLREEQRQSGQDMSFDIKQAGADGIRKLTDSYKRTLGKAA